MTTPWRQHELKCDPLPFGAMLQGRKRFEYRRDDRGYRLKDTLLLREWSEESGYSGQSLLVVVDYIVHGPRFGIPEGFCVMSISKETP